MPPRRKRLPQVARGLHRLGTLAHDYVEPLGWECLTDPEDVAVAEVRSRWLWSCSPA